MKARQDIEAIRVFSIFGIIWYHANTPWHEVAYFGLIVFLILSIYLAGTTPPSLIFSIKKRASRLLVPWIIWLAAYGAANIIKGKPLFRLDNGLVAGVLTGSSIHLWYLPYAFLALVIYDQLRRRLTGRSLGIASVVLTLAFFALVPYWRPASLSLGAPWAQYLHAAPGILLGVFFSNLKQIPLGISRILVALLLIAACLRIPYAGVGLPYAIGILIGYLLATRLLDSRTPMALAALGRYSFGVYIIHIFILRPVAKLSFVHWSLVPIIVFAISIIVVAAIWRHYPRLAGRVF